VDGVIAVGDKLELEPSFFLGDRWHINQTYPKNNSPLFARSKQIVMFGVVPAAQTAPGILISTPAPPTHTGIRAQHPKRMGIDRNSQSPQGGEKRASCFSSG
jgi:hypothetical protein